MADKHQFWRDERIPHAELRLVKEGRQVCYAPHSHEQWSMGAIINGQSTFDYRDQSFDIKTGDLVLMNPYWVHVCNPVSDVWGYWMLYIDCSWLTALRQELTASETPSKKPGWQDIKTAVIKGPSQWFADYVDMAETLMDDQASVMEKQSSLIDFLSSLMAGLSQPVMPASLAMPTLFTDAKNQPALQLVADRLQSSAGQALDLASLAQLAGCSEGHLVRSFKRQFGLAPHAYLLNARIHIAQQLLRQGHAIADVALATGFTDQAHFQRVFKKLTAATPGQFLCLR